MIDTNLTFRDLPHSIKGIGAFVRRRIASRGLYARECVIKGITRDACNELIEKLNSGADYTSAWIEIAEDIESKLSWISADKKAHRLLREQEARSADRSVFASVPLHSSRSKRMPKKKLRR